MRAGERKFLNLYQALNPAQKAAVDSIAGPVMVVAGPGTGKTQVLTLRIANILRRTDLPPDAILALTFTRSAASTMRRRLVEIIGSAGYRVKIYTFHGFCNEIIKTYPEYFPRIIGSTAALPIDQIRLMTEIINKAKLEFLKPFGSPYYYLHHILSAIDYLKKENIKPVKLAKIPHDRTRELATLYQEYKHALAKHKLYDFNDMVMEAIKAIGKSAELRANLREEYQYILVDEHQDANQSQNEILRLLTDFDDAPNLFLVGDPKQAIFQFQGASLDNFNYFRRLYPGARIISLAINYRSGQLLLDGARCLALSSTGLEEESKIRLISSSGQPGEKIKTGVFPTEEREFEWLAEEIKKLVGKRREFDSVAVIFRDNRDADAIVEEFERNGVPFVVESEVNVLRDSDLQKLILLFRAIFYYGREEWLKLILHLDFFNLPPLDVWRLVESSALTKRPLYDLLDDPLKLKKLPLKHPERFLKLSIKLERWKVFSTNRNFSELFGVVINESKFLPHLLKQSEAVQKLEKLQAFFDELKNILKNKPDFTLADFIEHVALIEEHKLSINLKDEVHHNGVRLLTVHKAKGLEFDYVYIVRAYDGHFGRRRSVNFFNLPKRGTEAPLTADEGTESERRLFYVALTRAKKQVTVSYAETDRDRRPRLPSQFLSEIDNRLLDQADVISQSSAKTRARSAHSLAPRVYHGVKLTDRAFLIELFYRRGLSATALNNFLTCPLRYFFNNLLRVTKIKRRELLYGSAIHDTLKTFFDHYRSDHPLSTAKVIGIFNQGLDRQPISPGDRPAFVTKGDRALRGYLKQYKGTWSRFILNEFRVRGVLVSPNLRLTGQIDKIEFVTPDSHRVNVVDYKTGRPKSRREILGLNKNATGDYYRQLIFYKLLLELYDSKRFEVVTGEIDFIEPTADGKYKKEKFELDREAVADLRETIVQSVAEITSFKFFNRGCGKEDCEACTLWRLMGQRL